MNKNPTRKTAFIWHFMITCAIFANKVYYINFIIMLDENRLTCLFHGFAAHVTQTHAHSNTYADVYTSSKLKIKLTCYTSKPNMCKMNPNLLEPRKKDSIELKS